MCRLSADAEISFSNKTSEFLSVIRTSDELSIVCNHDSIPEGCKSELDWKILKVIGPLDFSLTGILASLSGLLAAARISIFAVSTYDTDYIFVKSDKLDASINALSASCHFI